MSDLRHSMKITAVLLKLGQTRIIVSPMSPKITEKREKREREREREKKRLATVLSFYSVDFRVSFLNDKKPVPKVITDSYSERPGFHKSRYIYIYIYIYIYYKYHTVALLENWTNGPSFH